MDVQTVAEFVERYLPERYAGALARIGSPPAGVALGLNVVGEGAWSLVPKADRLEVQTSLSDERVLTASMVTVDFQRLVLEQLAGFEQNSLLMGGRVLHWDSETFALVRAMPGSVLLRIADEGQQRAVLLTPGVRDIQFENVECTIDCELNDLLAFKAGTEQPMELFIAGKLRISGDVQLALALAGVLI